MKKLKNLSKIIFIFSLFMTGGVFSIINWQHISFSQQTEDLKMFCEYSRNIVFDTDGFAEDPSWIVMYLDFATNKFQITWSDFQFSSLFPSAWFDPIIQTGLRIWKSTLIAQREWSNNSLPANWNIWNLKFRSMRTTGAELVFWVDWRWDTDNISDTDLIYGSAGSDMLVYVSWASYNFLTGLCNWDAIGPVINTFSPNITANTRQVYYWNHTIRTPQFVSAKISHLSGLSFYVKDGDSTNKTQAGYISWTYPNLDLNYYRANTAWPDIYRPLNVADRSSWIDPDSLNFSISNVVTIFNKNNVNVFSGENKTRERRIRDYYIEIDPTQLQDYGIEWNISFHATGQEFSLKPLDFTQIFNPAIDPRLTDMDPFPGQTQVLPLSDIKLRVRDDWAGIDPDSLKLTVMHGANILAIFSGNDLNLSMTWWDADNPDFFIKIASGSKRSGNMLLYPIPTTPYTSNTITIIVQVKDYKNNQPSNPYDRYDFETRYSCGSYPGCQDPLRVEMFQYWEWNSEMFLYEDMYITWASPNIIDTGNNILYCWSWEVTMRIWTELEWPWITNPQIYTGEKLYIEWARAVLSWNLLLLYPD